MGTKEKKYQYKEKGNQDIDDCFMKNTIIKKSDLNKDTIRQVEKCQQLIFHLYRKSTIARDSKLHN